MNEDMGRRLEWLLEKHNLDTYNLADILGKSYNQCRRYLTGETPLTWDQLKILSKRFKVKIPWFFGEPTEEHPDIVIIRAGKEIFRMPLDGDTVFVIEQR